MADYTNNVTNIVRIPNHCLISAKISIYSKNNSLYIYK